MISLRTVPRVRGPATDRLPLALPLTVIAGGQARTGVSVGILTLSHGPASVASSTTETEPPLPPKQPALFTLKQTTHSVPRTDHSLLPKSDHSVPRKQTSLCPQNRPLSTPKTELPVSPKQTSLSPQNRTNSAPERNNLCYY